MTDEQERSGRHSDRVPQHIILRVLVGSHAYGTATEESDRDERVVFIVPTTDLFIVNASGRNKVRDTLWVEGIKEGQDLTGWEVQKFVQLALHGNPNALEVLWAPVVAQNQDGVNLRALRYAFLSRRRVYEAFRGYTQNQRIKMLNEPEIGWTRRNWKFAESYVRVLFQGCELLKTGQLPMHCNQFDTSQPIELVQIKRGDVDVGDVVAIARYLEGKLSQEYNASTLPEEPDLLAINRWLVNLRLTYWPPTVNDLREAEGLPPIHWEGGEPTWRTSHRGS